MKEFLFFFFLISIKTFCQTDKDNFFLEKDIQKICDKNFSNFHKAHLYFFKNQIDSSFFYSSQAYNDLNQKKELKPYLDYLYGVNAIGKKFFSLAQNKLENIPKDFKYKYLVNYNLGNIALNDRSYKEALKYYNLAIKSNKIKHKNRLKRLYHNIGVCYLHLKDFSNSEKYLLKELSISKSENDTLSIIYSKTDLGNLYYEQYKDNIAINYFEEAYELAKLFSDIQAKQITAQQLAIVEKNRKNYKESNRYLTEFIKWKDTLWNRDKISELLEKDKEIAIAKKDKEIAVQKQITVEQKERIRFYIIILIIISLFLCFLFYFFRVKTKQNKLIRSQKEQLEQLNNTKNYLFSVISHDLRTPVNTLHENHKKMSLLLQDKLYSEAIALNTKNKLTSESTSKILNNILNWALQQNNQLMFVPEINSLEVLIASSLYEFKPIAQSKNITITEDYDASEKQVFIDKELFKIAFRNLIDNAIKYTPNDGFINIKTGLSNSKYYVTIEDTGKGISKDILTIINNHDALTVEKINRSKGLGLGLILSKTLILKNKGTLAIKNNPQQGVTITIAFPVKED